MPFSTPAAPSGGIDLKAHLQALILVEPVSLEEKVQTVHGPSDAIKANVHVLDGAGAPESYAETLIFPKILVGQLKSQIGQKVLGRLGQGTAKPGQSAPWVLNEASAEDIAKAEAWVAQNAPAVTSATAPF